PPVRLLNCNLDPMSPGPMIVARLRVLFDALRNGPMEGLSLKTTRVRAVEGTVILQAIPVAGAVPSRSNS
ncbi:MAG: hypothetical protein D3925_10810, partial [Candidatus Electrothrix sp. AR5]|nr:hypothetical protein [Candidatus Electrothrix sp. AR5]